MHYRSTAIKKSCQNNWTQIIELLQQISINEKHLLIALYLLKGYMYVII